MLKKLLNVAALMTIFASAAFAAEDADAIRAKVVTATNAFGFTALAAGIAIGLAVLGGALGQSKAAAAALEGMSRNPAASGKLLVPMIIALALIESLVLLAFVIAFVKIPL